MNIEMVGIEVFGAGYDRIGGSSESFEKGKNFSFLADQDAGEGGA